MLRCGNDHPEWFGGYYNDSAADWKAGNVVASLRMPSPPNGTFACRIS